ncbi:hypothetical protein H5410_023295 [Solanum commersonii]|uniref:Small ribosomal subunit protein uS8c n=1 Tax=Solanum commersonii TaxID=4109 RepID=A0A9J5ZK04_SOLCO|nr:hypothetical protein H5410_023295 [Solanum commersonii]
MLEIEGLTARLLPPFPTESRSAVIFVLVQEKCVSLKKYLEQSYCGLKHHIWSKSRTCYFVYYLFLWSDLYVYLQFGYIVLTTSAGIMDHEEARRKNVGGEVLGFLMLTRMKTLVLLLVVTDLFLFFLLPSNLLKILRQLSDFVEKLVGAYCLLRQLTSKVEETSFDRLCQSKKILTINGQFPGPTIYARAGETLALDIENKGKDNVTMGTGSRHVKFDQVEWLVEAGSTVRKNITISDDDEGTLWWHALNIWQCATVHGAFIVHPKSGTNQALPFSMPHDHAHIPIILGEWWKKDVKEIFLEYVDSGSDINSDAFTVNGQPGDFYPCSDNVDIGKKYLLKVVNAAMSKTLYFGIARHNLIVIAMDGSPITEPFTTDYIELTIQHSIHCIFEANQQPDYYYMVVVTNISEAYDTNKITTAIIEYQGSYIPSLPPLLPLLPNFSPTTIKVLVGIIYILIGLMKRNGHSHEKEAKKNKEEIEEVVNLQEQNNTGLSNDEIYRMAMIPMTKANKS